MPNVESFRIDWPDLKKFCLDTIRSGKVTGIKNASNQRHIREFLLENRDYWTGYSPGQLSRWLSDGYKAEAIQGLADFTPPLREKRKLRFVEEGDEFHYDLAASGAENFMSKFTHRETIPGVRIEAGIMFSASTDSRIVNTYNSWLCKIAYSLEAAGIDCQITLDFPSWSMANDSGRGASSGTLYHNIVRVKAENELVDFVSWSAMLSPAALRSLGFTVGALHSDYKNLTLSSSWGRGVPERQEWKCIYDAERRTIVVENVYSAHRNFPTDDMTRQFRECLKQLSGK